jgi:non-lysosomal glucosylceramidase
VHVFSTSGDLSSLHFTSADMDRPPEQRGDLAITTDGDGVEHVDYHFRGQWFDSLSLYWREFAKAGRLRERRYDKPRAARNMFQQPEHGTLARRLRIEPGETRRVRFAVSWNYPLGSIYWFNRAQPGDAEYAGEAPTWRNYYATQWADSAASGADAFARWDRLERDTFAFRDSIFGSSLPPEIIDAATIDIENDTPMCGTTSSTFARALAREAANMPGRKRIRIAGIPIGPAFSGDANIIPSIWSCSARTPG